MAAPGSPGRPRSRPRLLPGVSRARPGPSGISGGPTRRWGRRGAILDLLAMPMRSGTAKRATLTNANAEAPTFAEAVCTQSVCSAYSGPPWLGPRDWRGRASRPRPGNRRSTRPRQRQSKRPTPVG
eukprot:scaffold73671_cov78-Phaeocystis_antarctica.AAC.2